MGGGGKHFTSCTSPYYFSHALGIGHFAAAANGQAEQGRGEEILTFMLAEQHHCSSLRSEAKLSVRPGYVSDTTETAFIVPRTRDGTCFLSVNTGKRRS